MNSKKANSSKQDIPQKKTKEWKSLNMRNPGGMTILDLQKISHKGFLVEPKIPDSYLDHYGLEDKFNEEEIRSFKEAFMFFDREGDGTMAIEDLGLALRALGFLVTGKEVKELQYKYDPDHSGSIDIKDFLSCIADVSNKADGAEIVQQCFSVLDKDGTGAIKIDEFKHVLKAIGDVLSDDEIATMLQDLDNYGDGYVRMKDLVNILTINH